MRKGIWLRLPIAIIVVWSVIGTQAAMAGVPITLEQALAQAIKHNFSIRQARERIRQHEGVVTQVAAAGLPGVSLTGSYLRSSTPTIQRNAGQTSTIPVFVPSGRYWRMIFTVRQTLYAGGGNPRSPQSQSTDVYPDKLIA